MSLGNGPGKDAQLKLVSDLSVNGPDVWHPAITDEAEIANHCRMFLYPGDAGLSLIHGMAYGLPVIVHNDRSRHMPEIAAFQAEKTGVTFEPREAECLRYAIADSIDNNGRLDEMSRANFGNGH